MAFLREFRSDEWSVIVEDDDTVAYAYLLDCGRIVSDVWLYNHGPAPKIAPWRTGTEMPFPNPVEYLINSDATPIPPPESVDVSWPADDLSVMEVTVRIAGEPVAWLAPDAKPGWSALVRRDGPVARAREAGR
jgi:hypothetical protein